MAAFIIFYSFSVYILTMYKGINAKPRPYWASVSVM